MEGAALCVCCVVGRRTQRACLDAFFAQNGYLEASSAAKLQVHTQRQTLRHTCLSSIHERPYGKRRGRGLRRTVCVI